MFPFDVILFDVGGVLLTNGWDTREAQPGLEQFQLDKAEFEKRHPVPNDAWEREAISADRVSRRNRFLRAAQLFDR